VDGGGGTVSTGSVATSTDPVETSVTVPAGTGGGTVTIDEIVPTETPPSGFAFVGQQVNISANISPPAATAENPLVLTFNVHSSIAGTDPDAVKIFKASVLVEACTEADATPDPCVGSRTLVGDNIEIVVRTSTASIWNFGQSDGDGDGVPDARDNCIMLSNPYQDDSDGDLCGNRCDADYDQDNVISISDFAAFRTCFIGNVPGVCDHVPEDLDGAISIQDFSAFRQQFVAGVPGPGQSAACNGL
jgi:hypothetical protein